MSTTDDVTTTPRDDPRPVEQPAIRPGTAIVSWRPDAAPWATSTARKTALCRETAGGWILQHVRTVTVSQRATSEATIDTEPVLEDLPGHVRARLPEALEVGDGV